MFTGIAPQKSKAEIRSRSAIIMVMKATDFIALAPPDQSTKTIDISVAGSMPIYMVGVAEYKTVKSTVVGGESVQDQLKTTIEINKNLEGEATLLGTYENDALDDLENETWTMFLADPDSVSSMASWDPASQILVQTVGESFLAHEILDKVTINTGESGEYGEAQRTPMTFTKELESMSDGRFKAIVTSFSA